MNKQKTQKWAEYIYKTSPQAKDYVNYLIPAGSKPSSISKILAPAIPYFIRRDKAMQADMFAKKKEAFNRIISGDSGEQRIIYAARRPYEEDARRLLKDLRAFMAGKPRGQLNRIIRALRKGQ